MNDYLSRFGQTSGTQMTPDQYMEQDPSQMFNFTSTPQASAGGAAAGTSEHNRRTLIVSPHRARGISATLMTSILFCTRLTKLLGRATSQKVHSSLWGSRTCKVCEFTALHRNHDAKVLKPSFPYTTNAGAGCSVARASSSSTSQR